MCNARFSAVAAFVLLTLGVPAAHAKTCDVTGAGVAFGAVDITSPADQDTMGFLSISCNGSIDVELSLSVGNGVGASYLAGRKMTHGSGQGQLRYQLYANAGRTQVLGDGTGGSTTLKIRKVHSFSQAIWARVGGGQHTVQPGSYQDTVIATICY